MLGETEGVWGGQKALIDVLERHRGYGQRSLRIVCERVIWKLSATLKMKVNKGVTPISRVCGVWNVYGVQWQVLLKQLRKTVDAKELNRDLRRVASPRNLEGMSENTEESVRIQTGWVISDIPECHTRTGIV